jgi:3-phosphoshikimate 1-carboxyvinyltransferase
MLPAEKSPSPSWEGSGRGSETIEPANQVTGSVRVPGDKSIAHRALILASLADGDSVINGLPEGEDVRATMACLRSLGVTIAPLPSRERREITPSPSRERREITPSPLWGGQRRGYRITPAATRGGPGWGFATPHGPLECANSGTTMRLLAGVLAGSRVSATLDGDSSLRRRPMGRVIEPLHRMGARIDSNDGRAPMVVTGTPLQGRHHILPVPSAQVKSAILLAGLAASGPTTIVEPEPTRDHTERLLVAMGADLRVSFPPSLAGEGQGGGPTIELRPSHRPLRSIQLDVPGDFSSAAFWLAAAAMRPGWSITVEGVGLNPSRTAFLGLLEAMGAEVMVHVTSDRLEPVGSVTVVGRPLRAVDLGAAAVAAAIDEIPALLAVASQAEGVTRIDGAAELRVKESDRLAGMAEGMRRMGVIVEDHADGISIHGPSPLRGATVASNGDHRIAMALAIAGLVASQPTAIEDADCVAVSYPGFFADLRRISLPLVGRDAEGV